MTWGSPYWDEAEKERFEATSWRTGCPAVPHEAVNHKFSKVAS